ncbi:RecB family exonuclease [Cellulomonas sp. APG4]|uniref:RecB family exonuclease n=1 Tax=Cellulomonas sp. APG4 TaxID=1538656 RepID=UPI00351BA6C7
MLVPDSQPATGPTTDPGPPAATTGPIATATLTRPDEPPRRRRPGLSPSRAADYLQCPLLFRFRVVDRLPEPPSAAAVRGTLVHAVLERLFDAPAGERTPDAARALLPQAWDGMVETQPDCADVLPDASDLTDWFAQAGTLLDRWFTLEDPNRLEPAERELHVSTDLDDGLELRGIIDRLDVAPNGAIRVVDYKTGRSPREGFESKPMFQMRFYALVVSRLRGRVPDMLQLVYLGDGRLLRHVPDAGDVAATERKVRALWESVRRSAETGTWQPRRSALCDWCAHQSLCPVFGGTPPPVPDGAIELTLGLRP